MYKYKAHVVKVVDGDTFDFMIDLGFRMYTQIRVRLKGYDAPEIRGPEREEGKAVKQICVQILTAAEQIYIETTKTGKYGRWLADVEVDGIDLKDFLPKEGLYEKTK